MKKPAILIMILLSSLISLKSQTYYFTGALSYSVPTYDKFFGSGFESRIGGRFGFSVARTPKLKIGGNYDFIRYLPYVDNPVKISEAKYHSITLQLAYDILEQDKNRLEPFIETGYYWLKYYPDKATDQSFGLNIGGQYFYDIDENYGLMIGGGLNNVFTKFGRSANPNIASMMQMFFIYFGFTIQLQK